MPLDLSDGTACFVDANIFYYHFVETLPFSDSCSDLLERADDGELTLFTSVHLLAEAMHKIMLAEAASRFGLTRASLVNWLQSNRQRIGELRDFREAVDELAAMPVTCLPITPQLLPRAAGLARERLLLTNDAMSVALMVQHGLIHLATNDDDFDSVPGIKVWKPR